MNTIEVVILVATCVSFWGLYTVQADERKSDESAQTEFIQAAGNWVSAQDGVARVGQRWNVDALRMQKDQIRGRIALSGTALFDSANVEAQLSGRGVFGKLVDDEGKELASFEGTVTSGGASGTYRDKNGDVGDWAWEGQLKQSDP